MKRVRLTLIAVVAALAVVQSAGLRQVTVSSTATYFPTDSQRTATQAFCRLETAQIRYVFDGSVATTTAGTLWEVGEEKLISNTTAWPNAVANFNAIRTGGTSGQLDCTFSP